MSFPFICSLVAHGFSTGDFICSTFITWVGALSTNLTVSTSPLYRHFLGETSPGKKHLGFHKVPKLRVVLTEVFGWAQGACLEESSRSGAWKKTPEGWREVTGGWVVHIIYRMYIIYIYIPLWKGSCFGNTVVGSELPKRPTTRKMWIKLDTI